MRIVYRLARLVLLLPFALLIQACGAQPAAPTPTPEAAAASAPDFTLPSANTGSSVNLADFRGQPVLLYFHMAVG
jgi:cytochrome oxidase Cu insertion factor (SCO1/SenC/PrrC family)